MRGGKYADLHIFKQESFLIKRNLGAPHELGIRHREQTALKVPQ